MANPQIYPHTLTGRAIRLLNIEAGDIDSPLRCTLQQISLEDASVTYYALSYCWGANQSPKEITCNSQRLTITPNLHAALIQYRRRGTDVPLWVDAICIDQSNVTERTSQVRMMQDIYSKAMRVLVWLGAAEVTDAMALEVLKAIHAPWATFRDPTSGRVFPLFFGQNVASYDASLAARVPDAYFDALAAFLLRPWFSRIWIVQELICARELTIWCGEATLNEDFPVLEAAARLVAMHNCSTKTQLATVTLQDKSAQGIGRTKLICAGRLWGMKTFRDKGLNGIFWYLLITRCFDATEPRDKIFALVGLVDDISDEFVDYSKSYEDVLQELSHMLLDGSILNTTGSPLDLLTCITRDEDDNLNEPSWVVDWLRLRDSLYAPSMNQFLSERPVIVRAPEIQFVDTDNEETLHIRGTVFDIVTHIVPSPIHMRQIVPQSDFLTPRHLPSCVAWHDEAITVTSSTLNNPENIYRASGEPLYEAFWRTLCGNRSAQNPLQPPVDDSSYLAWRRFLVLQEDRLDLETKYRNVCTLGKRVSCCVTVAVGMGLTYRFRGHRLVSVAIPFSLPSIVRFVSDIWDGAQQALLIRLFNHYMQQSTQVQIDQRDFESSHSQWTQGRQFGLTQEGLMGWLPLAARVGDHVGLFAGCRVPFVLRAFDQGYKLVGDAYVHGVMDGEGEASEGEMLPIL